MIFYPHIIVIRSVTIEVSILKDSAVALKPNLYQKSESERGPEVSAHLV